jgi:isorenieratene synthase
VRTEYLAFDLAVLAGPAVLSCIPGPPFFAHRWTKALAATLLAGIPFVLWDVLVAGRHWWFDDAYLLGPRLLGLPIEEWGFFLVVPLSCLYVWEKVVRADTGPRRAALRTMGLALGALVPLAALAASRGKEYTALSLGALGAAGVVDGTVGARVLGRARGWWGLLAVAALTLVCNNYLTGRPIVLYDERYQVGVRLFTMPVEDLGFGLAHVLLAFSAYEWLKEREAREPSFGLVGRLVRRVLGGYRHTVVEPEANLPERLEGAPRRVCVIGGGIAGLTCATTLAERGFAVTLVEKSDYLGGKLGGWTFEHGGETLRVDHGFHAFFRQYYNLDRFLHRLGVREHLRPIGDYRIWTRDGRSVSFAGTSTVPGLNLLSLARTGLYRLRPLAFGPAGQKLEAMLRYDKEKTFSALDGTSFDDFADAAQLPRDLRMVFASFARAFFSDGRLMSMAELVKGFHFYYLSNDAGLLYDYLDDDFALTFAGPLRERLGALGAEVRMGRAVRSVERDTGGSGLRVDGERFDWVVLAADVPGTRAILEGSPALLGESPELARKVAALRPGQRYAVLRLWLGEPIDVQGPAFVITERPRVLDSVTFVHRVTEDARAWAARTGGSVIELHAYALPEDLADADVRGALLDDFHAYVAAAKDATVVHEHLQLRRDFPAFHVGMAKDRPGVVSGVDRLLLAGDWVDLPWPMMLMEAACTSGLVSANAILADAGLRRERIESVPLRGLLAGVPERPRKG